MKIKFVAAIAAMACLGFNSIRADVVSQWSFESNLNDTAAAGSTADNLTDNTDGGVSYVPGVVGMAGVIPDTADGSSRLTAVTSADLNLGANWTLEAFVWPDSGNDPNAEWERVWTKWGEGGNEYHTAFRGAAGMPVPDGLDLFVNGGDNIINHNSTVTVPRETWSHFAFVGNQDAGTITAWLNGQQVGSTDYVAVATTSGNMNFGNFGSGNQASLQYSGYIDEALIHDIAADEAYLQGRAALIPEPSSMALLIFGVLSLLGYHRRR